ncbi:hypothetical protein [Kitasatospora cineracea]|uniref:Uncharacterized protein n=1 Tax=Kitasatospora cineracea TaxID=88074 RepID=A0A3N4S8E9_9ACTN|nr:hypothetical protein [Kitasatospora cineracea]RPE34960.1 hypothetical protein EDD38_3303 [Kitasatospora cineracea]
MDGIYPGQTWAARHQTAHSVRVTVVDGPRIGFTPKGCDTVKYLTRRKFAARHLRVQPAV